ncbi:unnamed protein product [Paramecium sonneborni]|uniref:Uncharacterized protein n=1 Tax=Paramecium sonneborni TaxID=65129 RepID=A0A8S1NSF7_9CILI|nr:unnamed protein product [Paramecium sonneborni]
MVNFTISLLNVWNQSILMLRLQGNRHQMFLVILRQKQIRVAKNKLFILKRMVMEFLMKNHVNQYWKNQKIMQRLDVLEKQDNIQISTLTLNEEIKFKKKNLFSEEPNDQCSNSYFIIKKYNLDQYNSSLIKVNLIQYCINN